MNSKEPYRKYGFHVKYPDNTLLVTNNDDLVRFTVRNRRVYSTIELSKEDAVDLMNFLKTEVK